VLDVSGGQLIGRERELGLSEQNNQREMRDHFTARGTGDWTVLLAPYGYFIVLIACVRKFRIRTINDVV